MSKTATCGMPGSALRAASSARSAGALCSGASGVELARCAAATPSSTTTGSRNRAPPWTMRWPDRVDPPRGRSSSDAIGVHLAVLVDEVAA